MRSSTMHRFSALAASLGLAIVIGTADAGDWTLISERDGITSYLQPMPNEPIEAVRGVTTVELPACQLISFYVDPKLATTWVDMLVDYKMITIKEHHTLVWQKYDMPWPVTDRDFLLDVNVKRPNDRSLMVTLVSTEDARFPTPGPDDNVVRGRMSPSSWTFTQLSDSSTRVDMVGHVDPSGAFPPWLTNLIQHTFPYNTLSAFIREAGKVKVPLRTECADW